MVFGSVDHWRLCRLCMSASIGGVAAWVLQIADQRVSLLVGHCAWELGGLGVAYRIVCVVRTRKLSERQPCITGALPVTPAPAPPCRSTRSTGSPTVARRQPLAHGEAGRGRRRLHRGSLRTLEQSRVKPSPSSPRHVYRVVSSHTVLVFVLWRSALGLGLALRWACCVFV